MSKIGKPKKSLLTVFFCDDVENLSSQTKLKTKILLLYIFYKNLKGFFSILYIEDARGFRKPKKTHRLFLRKL